MSWALPPAGAGRTPLGGWPDGRGCTWHPPYSLLDLASFRPGLAGWGRLFPPPLLDPWLPDQLQYWRKT